MRQSIFAALGFPLMCFPALAEERVVRWQGEIITVVNDEEDEPAPAVNGQVQVRRVVLSVSVEHWIFGQEGTHGTEMLKAFLQQKLAAIQREYEELGASQLAKLTLAGRGDIKRFLDQVAALKAKYPQNTIDQEQLQQVLADVQKLRQQLRSDQFFGSQSLLTKTLRSLIVKDGLKPKSIVPAGPAANSIDFNPFAEDEVPAMILRGQVPGQARVVRLVRIDPVPPVLGIRRPGVPVLNPLRDEPYYRALIYVIVTCFDPETPFREEQREALTGMLRRVSQRKPQIPLDDPIITLCHLSKLPDEEFAAVLDKGQWIGLRRQFEAAKLQIQTRQEEAKLANPVALPLPGALRNGFTKLRHAEYP